MMRRALEIPLLLVAALACRGQPASLLANVRAATGLEGTVRRGPVQPVCRVDQPCDAPFSAAFRVWQEQLLVARFRSDSNGHYEVRLDPGAYTVTADSGAPIWPAGQPHDVTVGPVGLTRADLEFDTGIR